MIKAEGQDAVIRENVEAALKRDIDPETLDPRLVHPYTMSLIAETYGFSVNLASKGENSIVWSLKKTA